MVKPFRPNQLVPVQKSPCIAAYVDIWGILSDRRNPPVVCTSVLFWRTAQAVARCSIPVI